MPRPLRDVLLDLDTLPVEIPDTLPEEIWARIATAPEAASGRSRPSDGVVRRLARGRPLLAAVALAAVIVIVTGVVVLVPKPESALAVVRRARVQFRTPPPMTLTVERTVSVAQMEGELLRRPEQDWVQTTDIAFENDTVWRTEVVGDEGNPSTTPELGRIGVSDGTYHGLYEPSIKQFMVDDAPQRSDQPGAGLYLVSPALHEGPRLDDASIEEKCDVEDDARIAGRTARHIRCDLDVQQEMEGLSPGDRADVYLDRETGLVLQMSFPNGAGHRVTKIAYGVDHPSDRFEVVAPEGATVVWNGTADVPERYRTPVPEGVVATSVSPRRPSDMVSAAGRVWVATAAAEETDLSSGELVELDPRTGAVKRTANVPPARASLDGEMRDIASVSELTADGSTIYVLTMAGRLYTFDAVGGTFRGEPVDVGQSALRVAAFDGQVWVVAASTEAITPGAPQAFLRRIDPSTGEVLATVELAGSPFLGGMAYGHGAIWLSVWEASRQIDGSVYAVLRVDPASGSILSRTVTESSGLMVITNDGALVGRDTVQRVDRDGRIVATVALPGMPGQAVAAPDGTVWVSFTEGSELAQLDGAGALLRTQDVGPTPTSIAVTEDAVWASVLGNRTVARVPT